MKGTIAILLAALMLMSFAACKSNVVDPTTQLPNPIIEYDTADELANFGYPIDAPADAANVRYSIISEQIAQVQFRLAGCDYTYRAAVMSEEDIAGVYETFDETAKSVNAEGANYTLSATIRTVDGGKQSLASWHDEDAQFTLFTPDEAGEGAVEALVLQLAENYYAAK